MKKLVYHIGMKRLLVICDDWEALERYEDHLSPHFAVLAAPFAQVGYEMAREEQPDQILIDLVFEDVSVVEAVRILRKSTVTRDIPITVILDQREMVLVDHGIFPIKKRDRSVTRPFEFSKLIELLKEGQEA